MPEAGQNEERPDTGRAIRSESQNLTQIPRFIRPPPVPKSSSVTMVRGPEHNAPAWLELSCREEVYIQHPKTYVPDINRECPAFLRELINNEYEDLNCAHARYVTAHGGVEAIAAKISTGIDPCLQEIRGYPMTQSTFQNMILQQVGTWTKNQMTVYANLVTDERNSDYLRLYVGQSNLPLRRILRDHVTNIRQGATHSLHYFTIWMGNGHRMANFIRLWSSDMDSSDDDNRLFADIVEALFCRIFDTCHGLRNTGTPCLGLNVMTPLLQGHLKTDAQTARYTNAIAGCPDPQIREFLSQRSLRQNVQEKLLKTPAWSQKAYLKAFEECVGDPQQISSIRQCFQAALRELPSTPQTSETGFAYQGSMAAPFGLVLDFPFVQPLITAASKHPSSGTKDGLPLWLEKTGFTKDNLLAWTFDFKPFESNENLRLDDLDESQQSDIRGFHKKIFEMSRLKIVLLCGTKSEEMIMSTISYDRKYLMKLRCFNHNLYVRYTEDSTCKQVLISCQQLPAGLDGNSLLNVTAICQLFKFVAVLTNLKNLRPYTLSNVSALRTVFGQRSREKNGADLMAVDNMNPLVRGWLQRKGFNSDEELQELTSLTGCLTQALIVIALNLPRMPTLESGAKRSAPMRQFFPAQKCYPVIPNYHRCAKRVQEILASREARFEMLADRHTNRDNNRAADDTSDEFTEYSSDNSGTVLSDEDLYEEALHVEALSQEDLGEDDIDHDILAKDFMAPLCPRQDQLSYSGSKEVGSSVDTQTLQATENVSRNPQKQHLKKGQGFWTSQADVFEGMRYPYDLSGYVHRDLKICHCSIWLPEALELGDTGVDIVIHIAPEDTRHEKSYAKDAQDFDVGKRLAFQVYYTDSRGAERDFWPTRSKDTAVFRANSCVDLLANRKQHADLAQIPRRFVACSNTERQERNLISCHDGGYTTPNRRPRIIPQVYVIR